jgi:hypothetical protein
MFGNAREKRNCSMWFGKPQQVKSRQQANKQEAATHL